MVEYTWRVRYLDDQLAFVQTEDVDTYQEAEELTMVETPPAGAVTAQISLVRTDEGDEVEAFAGGGPSGLLPEYFNGEKYVDEPGGEENPRVPQEYHDEAHQ